MRNLAAWMTVVALAVVQPQSRSAEIAEAIAAAVADRQAIGELTATARSELTSLYPPGGGPLWFDDAGRLRPAGRTAAEVLSRAADEGLDPGDYAIEDFGTINTPGFRAGEISARAVARFDVALSARMLRFLRDLHQGRIDPRALGWAVGLTRDRPDFAALLRDTIGRDRVVETIAEMRPPVAQYSALREALARYRRTADSVRDWDALPAAPAVVRPGERCEWLPVLYSRLATLADISASAARPSAGDPLDGAVLEGVKRFQARHGLAVDGVVGKATRLALDTPPSSRVRQIELAMERLRWLPHPTDQRVVVLNIPMFRLWALDSGLREAPALSMAVIVGRAIRTETPVMMKEMRSVVFRPYWNVPRSILLNEVLGPLSRDPSSYLARNSMEIVQGAGDDARRVAAVPENLERLRSGSLRLRQRPGPNNSLGLIKFVFPNEADVYMHGTPAQRLFAQSRRDFSHGCVRVEDPVALAEWVLAGMDGWTRDRIVSSMQGEHTFELTLDRPIQVVLLYTTTAVMPEDGTIHFAHDIYREDAALERALGARRGRG